MANTLGTLSGIEVVQDVLSTLLVEFPILGQIATDFSGKGALFNQQVTTRVIVPTTAAAFDPAVGYTVSDRTAIDVPITINSQAHHTYQVTDREQSQTNRRLRDEFVQTASHALGTKLVTDLFATVLAASYPLLYTSAAAAFDAGDVRRIKTLLNKAFVPDLNRFMVINSDFAEGLGLDNLVIANPSGANNTAINTGMLPRIHGFQPSEFASLPTNGENLAGIAGNKESIIMATRVPDLPQGATNIPGTIATVTEPNSGLSVQLRQWYEMDPGIWKEALTVMYGFAVGLSEAGLSKRLVRIVTP